jgi:hypothetical protein
MTEAQRGNYPEWARKKNIQKFLKIKNVRESGEKRTGLVNQI